MTDMAGFSEREEEEFLLHHGPKQVRKAIKERRKAREEVRDGKFAFVVNSVTTLVGTPPPGVPTPMGEWRMVSITATNIGDQPQSFCPQNQKLIDVAGHDYASDGMAAIAMNENAIIVDMNPGFSVKVWVPFDVPPGTEVAVVELHDSAFSDGAWVNLK